MNCHFPFGSCLFCIINTHPFLLNLRCVWYNIS
nr:MAG TPA: hypothetical protein [Caudoviricetes sp.]